jgi:CRP-like cAMP-binding protein
MLDNYLGFLYFIKMSKVNTLWGNIFRRNDKAEIDEVSTLKGVPIFGELRDGEIRELRHIVHHRHYKENEIIFHEGEPGVGMYIIHKGDVGIFRGEEEIARLSKGDFFGEISLLTEAPRSASAVSFTETEIIGLFRPDLLGLIERNQRLGVKVLMKLGEVIALRLRKTGEELQAIKSTGEKPESS